jgi:hypothetical protein
MNLTIGSWGILVLTVLSVASLSSTLQGAAAPKLAANGAAAAWSLAGREGECTSLDLLKKKYPEFGEVNSPYQLADKLKAAGDKAEIKEYRLGKRPSIEVRVPAKNFYVMFIQTDLCEKTAPAKK